MEMVNSIPFVFSLIISFLDNIKPVDIGTGFVVVELKYTRLRCFKHHFYCLH